jgi:hypothetical protein
MKCVLSAAGLGVFLCLLTNPAFAHENSNNSEAARLDQSLLSIWDKPAFSPVPYMDLVPWLDSLTTKGPQIDFLLSPNWESSGSFLAQKGSWPKYPEGASQKTD